MGQNPATKYTDEFGRETADYVISSGKPITECCRELGLNPKTVNNWVVKRRRELGGEPDPKADDAEPPVPTTVLRGDITLDWLHLFGQFFEEQPRLPELDGAHVAERRVDPEVVVPVDVVGQLGLQVAEVREALAVDELRLEYPVRRLVDGVVVGAALGGERPLYAEGL